MNTLIPIIANPLLTPEIPSANAYYYNPVSLRCNVEQSEMENLRILESLIQTEDVDGLSQSSILKKYGINYAFGVQANTLLHLAYSFNKPTIIEWLLKNGANERICNSSGICPMQWSQPEYKDSQIRVINELVKRCMERCPSSFMKPDILYDAILEFIQEKKWCYCDNENKHYLPFKDHIKVVSLGLPSLIFNVNCVTLSELFVNVAKKVGLKAEVVYYFNYQSILSSEKDARKICGEFKMFDGSQSEPFKFDTHAVAFSSGTYYDLTLMSKYNDKDLILLKG